MTEAASNSRRIAKNTLMLYFRMSVIMLVSLYTSRVVLGALGVENYGFDHACVLCESNVEHDGKVTYLPIYMTMFMPRES